MSDLKEGNTIVMMQKAAIAILCATSLNLTLAGSASAQSRSERVEQRQAEAEADRLAELAFIAQDLGVPVPLGQGTPQGLFGEKPSDFPPELWVAGKQGKVGIAVPVNVAGHPTDCRVRETSGIEAFDKKTCELTLKRARFQPALDADGKPIAAEYWGSYTWRIRKPTLSNSFAVSIAYTVTAEGEVVDCRVLEASGELAPRQKERIENQPCPTSSFIGGGVFRDENGVPVSRRVTVSNAVLVTDPVTAADQL